MLLGSLVMGAGMNTQEQIESIERDIAEAQRKLAELKRAQAESYNGPVVGYYWDRLSNHARHGVCSGNGILYGTMEEAEWQGNSERVRRKLQRIVKALDHPPIGFERGRTPAYWLCIGDGVESFTGFSFSSKETRDKVKEILGDDIKYLDWYNSPEFRRPEK